MLKLIYCDKIKTKTAQKLCSIVFNIFVLTQQWKSLRLEFILNIDIYLIVLAYFLNWTIKLNNLVIQWYVLNGERLWNYTLFIIKKNQWQETRLAKISN